MKTGFTGYQSKKNLNPIISGQQQLELFLNAVEFVSFDLFDTLIQRTELFSPKDLFYLVQKETEKQLQLYVPNFVFMRVSAEENVRTRSWGYGVKEITLDNIYDELRRMLNFEAYTAQRLKNIELGCERAVLTQLESGKKLFELALEAGKPVVITSDTYFDKSFIFEVLQKNNYDQAKKLYISSATGMTKADGSMYDFVLKDLACTPDRMLHIGDNPYSDVAVPLGKGIRAFLLPTPKHLWRWKHGLKEQPSGNLCVSSMLCGISRQSSSKTFSDRNIGTIMKTAAQHLSLVYLGFATWLHEQFKKNNYQRVYFASRDGLIMKRFFDLLTALSGAQVESRYLYVSRATLYPSMIFTDPETACNLFCQNWDRLTLAEALKRIALSSKEVTGELMQFDLANPGLLLNRSTAATFRAFLKKIWPLLERKHKKNFQLMTDYLHQERVLSSKKTAFVDIGWHGSLQNCLVKIFKHFKIKKELEGYYLGTFASPPGASKDFKAKGYLAENDEPRHLAAMIHASPSLLELFHSAGHGGVVGYKKNGDRVLPELEKNTVENKQFKNVIGPIQNLSFDLVSKQLSITDGEWMQAPEPSLIAAAALRIIYAPTVSEAEIFGRLKIASDFGGSFKSITGVLEYDLKKAPGACLPDGTLPIWRAGFETLRESKTKLRISDDIFPKIRPLP